MVHWTQFDPAKFDIDFIEFKLAAHDITVTEASEVLWNGFRVMRDKHHEDRYRLLGRTDSGRPLELVAVVLGSRRLRIITGWPL